MVKKINPNGSKTIYVGGIYEVDKTSGDTVTRTVTYYPAGGAMRIVDSTNNKLYYILKDHLGSASVVTDASGVTVGEQRYYPYGATRWTTGTIYTDKLYTGQREITGLGIYHYGARFYSPYINRFLSPDTIVPGAGNPQALNRYSYVLGNPLRYNDPTGHTSACVGANVDPECNGGVDNWAPPSGVTYWRVNIKLRFGVTLSNDGDKDWDEGNAKFVYESLGNIETVVGSNLKPHVAGATFMLSEHHPDKDHPNSTYHGWTDGINVTFYTTSSQVIRQMNFYHEFGHVLNSLPGRDNIFSNQLAGLDHPSFISGGYVNRSALANPADVFVQASSNAVTEQWADVFANYIAGNINTTSPFGPGMEMYNFVHDVLTVQLGP